MKKLTVTFTILCTDNNEAVSATEFFAQIGDIIAARVPGHLAVACEPISDEAAKAFDKAYDADDLEGAKEALGVRDEGGEVTPRRMGGTLN